MNNNSGLTQKEVLSLRARFAYNELREKKQYSYLKLLLSQLSSPLIYILLLAAVVTFFLREWRDTLIILLAVVMNTLLGFLQESKAQKTLESLKKLLAPKAKVIRNGERILLPARELVPGDIVILELGTRIPADGILLKAESFSVNEAILTGESVAVRKNVNNEIYMSTTVASGIATMRVTAIGQKSKMGQIASSLTETKESKTPLQQRLDEVSKFLAIFVGLTGVFVFVVGIVLGHSFMEMFTTSVALAVASIPEGLAVSLTVILAVGMQRILKQKAIVRRLVAAETLGSVTVICADKTGTLTEGKMRVVGCKLDNRRWGVKAAVLCNDQRDPLEFGMAEWAAEQAEYTPDFIKKYPRLASIPFDPDHKYIATLHKDGKKQVLLVSGAPEMILEKSKLSQTEKKQWINSFEESAGKGYRIVSFAIKEDYAGTKISREKIKDLQFLGILFFEDPPRAGVKQAFIECRGAGIKIKVITGDYKNTAISIMQKLGLLDNTNENLVIEGSEFEKMTVKEKKEKIKDAILFSRVTPWQKLEIVEILQDSNEVVAMTGDGVNDAPALKKADIGIVVEDASDVSKDTADMVLLDSNLNTIVHAVEEGRAMFDNIRKIILYLLCDAFGEVILVIGSLLLRIPLAITASQILWINLVSDGFPNLALTVEPKEDDLMAKKPRPMSEPIINSEVKILIALISGTAGVLTFGLYFYHLNILNTSLATARTIAFASMGINTLLYVFSCRNLNKPLFKENQLKNPWLLAAVAGGALMQLGAIYWKPLQNFLNTVSLSWKDWEQILFINLLVIFLIEWVKGIFIKKEKKKQA